MPFTRDQHDFVMAIGELHVDEDVAFLDGDGDDAALAHVGELGKGRFLHRAFAGGEEKVGVLLPGDVLAVGTGFGFDPDEGGDFFFGFQFEQIGDAAAFGGAPHIGHFMDALDIHTPGVGEEHQVIVRAGGEEMLDEIRLLAFHGRLSMVTMPITPLPPRRWAR